MANALGKLFGDIAAAIRSKNGETGKMKPAEFPAKIAAIETGGGGSVAGVCYVTFMSYDGKTEYGKKAVLIGDDCNDPIAKGVFDTPTRENTVQYNFSFAGWATAAFGGLDAAALQNVTEDRTVYANYIATIRCYKIRYYDGDTLLHTESLAYGTTPSYTPEKENYVFDGWTPSLKTVTADADYYSSWIAVDVVVATGEFGATSTWTLYASGKMLVEGTGVGNDYSGFNQSWYQHASEITSVEVSDGITGIGAKSFNNYYKNITALSLPDSLTSVGAQAFAGTKIEELTIPKNLTTVGENAFATNTIKKIIFHTSEFNTADRQVFNTSNCEEVYVDSIEAWMRHDFYSIYSPLYTSGCTLYIGGKAISGDIVIPDGVTKIPADAFKGQAITSVEFADSVETIGSNAFKDCTSLKCVKFGNTPVVATSIFGGCTALEEIHTPSMEVWCENNFVSQYGTATSPFAGNGNAGFYVNGVRVTQISVPAGITRIGGGVFAQMASVTQITLPDSVTEICDSAFYGNKGITSITIPQAVVSIGKMAFSSAGITSATFANKTGWWVTTDAAATSGTAVTLSTASGNATLLKSTHAGKYWRRT